MSVSSLQIVSQERAKTRVMNTDALLRLHTRRDATETQRYRDVRRTQPIAAAVLCWMNVTNASWTVFPSSAQEARLSATAPVSAVCFYIEKLFQLQLIREQCWKEPNRISSRNASVWRGEVAPSRAHIDQSHPKMFRFGKNKTVGDAKDYRIHLKGFCWRAQTALNNQSTAPEQKKKSRPTL